LVHDFCPGAQKQSNVWVWREKILFEITCVVYMPITLDEPTINRVFGHYARLLIDVDLSKPLIIMF